MVVAAIRSILCGYLRAAVGTSLAHDLLEER
jgi:hypothetical protein